MIISLAERVFRETISSCPNCHTKIKAYLVEEDGKIFLKKECPEHGNFILMISKHSRYYRKLTEYYFAVMPQKIRQQRYYIYLSKQCNLNCPICLLEPNQDKVSDISFIRFEEVIRKNKGARFYLYGAEPTMRNDLDRWIRLLKHYGNLVNLHTNGIRFSDYNYLKSMKKCGLDYVSLQFDGFDDNIYRIIRGRELLGIKLKTLDNLRKLGVSTGLNVTVVKGVNDCQIKAIIEYALDNDFVRDVTFTTLSHLGNANYNLSADRFFMPDELIEMVEEQTEGRISRRNVFLFQKLYYAFLSIFNIRRCFNFHHIPLLRDKKGFITLDEVFELRSFEKKLDVYSDMVRKNKKKAVAYLLTSLFFNLTGKVYTKLKCVPFNILLQGGGTPKVSSKVLLISFGTVCDFHKYDSLISEYCSQGLCFEDKGRILLRDTIPEAVMFYKG